MERPRDSWYGREVNIGSKRATCRAINSDTTRNRKDSLPEYPAQRNEADNEPFFLSCECAIGSVDCW